jgi:CheY-like chemotaxis protein
MKDQFLATLSHELRTPLNAILGWGQILDQEITAHKADPEFATIAQGLEVIERNARVQTQLIEDLLDVSRIISGKLSIDFKHVRLQEILRASIEVISQQASAKNVRILREPGSEALDPTVLGDPARLQQIVWNLLSNAIKFTPAKGTVCIGLAVEENQVHIRIQDSGQGISKEFLPFVFERFRQADPTTTRKHGGLGLGLSIVRQLVDIHKGTVHVESDGIGRGSLFVVTLPTIEAPALQEVSISAEQLLLDPPLTPAQDLDGIKVLVVDNEEDSLELVRRLLADVRADVLTANSAEQALRLLSQFKPHVLVSDIGMPGMDGYDLIRAIRESGDGISRIPAIALTAFASTEDKRLARQAGFQIHLAKPVDPEELRAVIAVLV